MKISHYFAPKNNEVRMYNIIMPIWLLVIFPVMWIPVLAGNFLIDSGLLLLFLKLRKHDNIKEKWKKSIVKVWLFGMLSDIVGGGIIVLVAVIAGMINGSTRFSQAILGNIWRDPGAAAVCIACMLLSSLLIYLFDSKISFKKAISDERERKILALLFAVVTMPWLFASGITSG